MWLPKRKTGYRPLIITLILAVVIHLQLVFTGVLPSFYDFWSSFFPRQEMRTPTKVQMVKVSKQQWQQNRKLRSATELEELKRLETPKPKEEEKAAIFDGQIVDVAPTPDSSMPKDARYLSEHNTNVEKESVSRYQRKDYQVAQSRPTVAEYSRGKSSSKPSEPGKQELAMVTRKQGRKSAPAKAESMAFEIPDMKRRQSLKLKLDLSAGALSTYQASEAISGNSDRLRLRPGKLADKLFPDGDGGEDQQTVAMFKRPSLEKLDMITGAPANDHLKDLPKGEETLLNSREFRYATFFNRIKRGVSENWRPGQAYVRHDPYGNIYGVKDRYTVLAVRLDAEGDLKDVSVAESSGVGFLDDAAITAFQGASPFPNPPTGLVESDGTIRFQFGFFFEIGDRPRIRAFRSRRNNPF